MNGLLSCGNKFKFNLYPKLPSEAKTFGTPLVVRKKPDVVTPNRLDGNTDLEWQPGDSERRSNGHARHGDFTGSLLVGSRT